MKRAPFKRDYVVGDAVKRTDSEAVGVVTKITPTMHGHLISDGASRAHVRVTWANGHPSAAIPEARLRKVPS